MQEYKITEQLLISTMNYIREVPTGKNTLESVNALVRELSICKKIEEENVEFTTKKIKKQNDNVK